MRSTGYI